MGIRVKKTCIYKHILSTEAMRSPWHDCTEQYALGSGDEHPNC